MRHGSHEFAPTGDGHDRREFLKACGRYGAITPPLISVLLSTSLTSNAIARSGGGEGGGRGKTGGDSGKPKGETRRRGSVRRTRL